jgi:hypothetical protein
MLEAVPIVHEGSISTLGTCSNSCWWFLSGSIRTIGIIITATAFFLMGDHTDLTFLELVEAKIAETPQGKCHGFNCRFSQETNQLKPQYDNPHYNPMKSTGFTMMISQHPNEMQP